MTLAEDSTQGILQLIPGIVFGIGVLLGLAWLAQNAGQSPLLAFLALIPVVGWLAFAVVVIRGRSKITHAERYARWAKDEDQA